jgi:hypothetical protein
MMITGRDQHVLTCQAIELALTRQNLGADTLR